MMKLGPYVVGPNDTLENGIYTGDARDLAKAIPDGSVDLIFTDPPYPKEYLPLFEWLSKEAARMLKPGGSCLILSGQMYFEQVFGWFCEHLSFYWLNCYYMPIPSLRIWPKKIQNGWKPVLWFVKGKRRAEQFVLDRVKGLFIDKRFHKWGQDEGWAFYWVNQLTGHEDIIVDPFCGGGTVPAVCKMLDRHWWACEIEPKVAELARQRVAQTKVPLFVLESQQLELAMP